MKRMMSLLLAVLLTLSLMPFSAFAERGANAPVEAFNSTSADTASAVTAPKQINANHVAIDNDPGGGYAGDYVVIYNPSTDPASSLSTGNMSGRIQTSVSASIQGGNENSGKDDRGYIIDIDAELAEEAEKLGFRGTMKEGEPVRALSFSVGDTRNFTIRPGRYPGYASNVAPSVEFKMLYAGEHCYVWTPVSEDNRTFPLDKINEDYAAMAAAEFDAKHALMQSSFGTHSNGTNGDGRVHLLFYNIISDGWQPNAGMGWNAGFFASADYNTNGLPCLNLDTYPSVRYESNDVFTDDISGAYSTMVHEYQHMIHYSVAGGGVGTWLNECMSAAAEEICYPGSSITTRIPSWTGSWAFNNPPREFAYDPSDELHNGYSMYAWDQGISGILTLYAQVSLFAQYIYTQHGNTTFRGILEKIASGQSFSQALYSVTRESASTFVRDFRIALTANTSQSVLSGRYGFTLQPNYNNSVNPYNLLGPVVFTGSSCTIMGGGAITVKPVGGVYNPPADASGELRYYGITLNSAEDVPPIEEAPVITPESGMKLSRSVRVEENGTFTEILSAYYAGGGTAYDASTSLNSFLSDYFSYDNSTRSVSYEFYPCIGLNPDGTYKFSDECQTSLSGSSMVDTPRYSNATVISGFDFSGNACVKTDQGYAGYKLVVYLRGYALKSAYAEAPGSYPFSTSCYIASGGYWTDGFPQAAAVIGGEYAVYDFGTALKYGGENASGAISLSDRVQKVTSPTTSKSGTAGTAAIAGGELTFTPNGINAETFSTFALVRLSEGGCKWTRLTFLPATTVLYEENYIPDFTNGSHGASWETVGTAEATVQSPAAEPYGYDESYADDAGAFSHGSARTVTVTRKLYDAINAGQPGASWPDARFSFKGTSLNLVSRLAPDGGIIVLNIVPKGQPASTVGANTVHRMVSTYYANGIVKQAPLFNINSLEYGEYDVYLSFVYLPYFDQQSVEQRSVAPGVIPGVAKVRYEIEGELPADMRAKGSLVSYIDAVRIYNPMGTPAEGSDAHKAYGEAGELAPVYDRFKSLVTDGSALLLELGASGPIEQSGSVNMNPNTEVYLGTNALLAFGVGQGFSRIHISLRSPTGQRVIANINGNRIAVAHAAELYYDITPFIGSGGNIRISCELPEGASGEPMLSIAGVKVIGAGSVNGLFVADDSVLGYVEALYYGVSGDADHDRQVTMTDALLTMRHALDVTQLDAYALYCADMDGSGSIEVGDALWIMRLCLA